MDDSSPNLEHLLSTLRPVKRATLHLLLERNELFFQYSYDWFDGTDIIHVFDQLLRALAPPKVIEFGDEAKKLSPPLKVAANIPDPTQRQVDKAEESSRKWKSSRPSIGLETINTDQLPGATRMCRLTLSEDNTINVIAEAKKRGFTQHMLCKLL